MPGEQALALPAGDECGDLRGEETGQFGPLPVDGPREPCEFERDRGWSANRVTSSISPSEKGSATSRQRSITPTTSSFASIGTPSIARKRPSRSASG